MLGKTSKPDDWQERLKGTRLWGSFELKDFKFEATLSMMLFLHPPVEEEFRLRYKVGCTSDSQRQRSLLGHMDEEEIALSASRLLRGVLQRSCLQIRLQSTLVKNTTVLTIYLLLVFVLGKTSKPDDWQERLKGTRLELKFKDFCFLRGSKHFLLGGVPSFKQAFQDRLPVEMLRMRANVFKPSAFCKSNRKLTDARSSLT